MNDKDQAAIDHVASVSKNPHAAMIVKWLITGWDVRFRQGNGDMCSTTDVTWNPGTYYELIEPKPDKPAYRVYKVKETGLTYTRDCLSGSRDNNDLSNRSDWISEWIEYDPPKKWPTPLVERIAAIDIKAAEWIVDHWDDLLDDKYTTGKSNKFSRSANSLNLMFRWNSSDLGGDYWYEISDKLGEQ